MNTPTNDTPEGAEALYAFWKHDQFPYLLGDQIARWVEDKVETVRYGRGYQFTPAKVVPLALGRQMQEQLDELRCNRTRDLGEVNAKYRGELGSLLFGWGLTGAA